MDVPEGQVIISVNEYNILLKNNEKLRALEHTGVDNWEGYDIAMKELKENNGKN